MLRMPLSVEEGEGRGLLDDTGHGFSWQPQRRHARQHVFAMFVPQCLAASPSVCLSVHARGAALTT